MSFLPIARIFLVAKNQCFSEPSVLRRAVEKRGLLNLLRSGCATIDYHAHVPIALGTRVSGLSLSFNDAGFHKRRCSERMPRPWSAPQRCFGF